MLSQTMPKREVFDEVSKLGKYPLPISNREKIEKKREREREREREKCVRNE